MVKRSEQDIGKLPPFLSGNADWVDALMASMSLEDKIAQLIHVAAWSNRGPEHEEEILDLIRETGIGGLIFFQGHPVRQAELTNRYQSASKVPLLISIDGEWGLGHALG